MAKNTRFVRLDVHAEAIAMSVAERRGQVRALGTVPSRPPAKPGDPSERLVGRRVHDASSSGFEILAEDAWMSSGDSQ